MDSINQYSVFARPDSKKRVIKIFSTCFDKPQDGDIFIKSGSGDEFVHVGYYNLYTSEGAHRYIIDSGSMREATPAEIEVEILPDVKKIRIEELKEQLTKTDYQAMKYAEGWMDETEYATIRERRQAWRDEINNLETEIAALEV